MAAPKSAAPSENENEARLPGSWPKTKAITAPMAAIWASARSTKITLRKQHVESEVAEDDHQHHADGERGGEETQDFEHRRRLLGQEEKALARRSTQRSTRAK